MTADNFEKVLESMFSRTPFMLFMVEQHNGKRFEIDLSRATVIRQGVAVFIAPGPVPVYFDHESVVQIIDSPASSAPGRNKGKAR